MTRPSFAQNTRPFAHQQKAFDETSSLDSFAILSEMGTGKSKIVLDTGVRLWCDGKIDKILIVAPKGVYNNWADSEIPKHVHPSIPTVVHVWSASATSKAAKEAERAVLACDRDHLGIAIVNVEALSLKKGMLWVKGFLQSANGRCLFVVDESTTIKNPGSRRTKAILKLGRVASHRRIVSGEPAANSPLNLWSQFEFLEPGILGHDTFVDFRSTYAITETVGEGRRQYSVVVDYRNVDQLMKKVGTLSFIVKKSECLDLPQKIYQMRDVQMSAEQAAAYDQMRRNSILILEDKMEKSQARSPRQMSLQEYLDNLGDPNQAELEPLEPLAMRTVTADIVIVQLLRLHQIVCGFVNDDDKKVVEFEKVPRMDELFNILEMVPSGQKAIIWATYRHNIKAIARELARKDGAGSLVTYFGETSDADRRDAVRLFQDPTSSVRWFVANQATAGYGLTLTEGTTAVYYANSYDAEKRNQSEDRTHRIGLKSSALYVDLRTKGTVDDKIIGALREKKSLSDLITPSNWATFFKS